MTVQIFALPSSHPKPRCERPATLSVNSGQRLCQYRWGQRESLVSEEVKREVVIRRVVAGKLSVAEAGPLLGLSERQVWRLKTRYVEEGASALAHGNRGRRPANRIGDAVRDKIGRLARSKYAGVNDSHLAELLNEREHLEISRRAAARPARGRSRQSATSSPAALSQPARARGKRRRDGARRRQPPPLVRRRSAVQHLRRRHRRRDQPGRRCLLPRAGGRGRVLHRARPDASDHGRTPCAVQRSPPSG